MQWAGHGRTRNVQCNDDGDAAGNGSAASYAEVLMSDTPIGDHALLCDCHSAALVDKGGSCRCSWVRDASLNDGGAVGRRLPRRGE